MSSLDNIRKVLTISLILVPLSFSPFYSYDPFNIPKFSSLVIFGSILLIFIIRQYRESITEIKRSEIKISILFIFWCYISLVFSGIQLTDGLFGIPGRNTGVLTYTFLQVLFISAIIVSDKRLSITVIQSLYLVSFLSFIYGLIQVFKFDPVNWSVPPSAIFSFFGNQNFLSSFISISIVSGIGFLLIPLNNSKLRLTAIFYTILSLVFIYFAKSTQGYLVFAIGFAASLTIFIYKHNKYRKYLKFILLIFVISVILIAADILQKLPWPSKLYEDSISARGDFWRAAIKISIENPVFGTGLDGFGDHYRSTRDLNSLSRGGIDLKTDSAHNLFLDLLSGGGVPLLLIYLIIILMVLSRSYKYIKNSDKFDPVHTGIFSAWLAYMAQALISINQIALAVVGFILAGLLIGYKDKVNEPPKKIIDSNSKKFKFSEVLLGIVAGLIIAIPPFTLDGEFRNALTQGNAEKLVDISDNWPMSSNRLSTIGSVLRTNGYPEYATLVLRKAIKFNPDHFESWYELLQCPDISINEKLAARLNIKRLDPLRIID